MHEFMEIFSERLSTSRKGLGSPEVKIYELHQKCVASGSAHTCNCNRYGVSGRNSQKPFHKNRLMTNFIERTYDKGGLASYKKTVGTATRQP